MIRKSPEINPGLFPYLACNFYYDNANIQKVPRVIYPRDFFLPNSFTEKKLEVNIKIFGIKFLLYVRGGGDSYIKNPPPRQRTVVPPIQSAHTYRYVMCI
jgi:hypothetical protein